MSISRLFGLQVVRPHLPRNSAHPCANPGADLGSGQMSGVVNRVAIWFYYRKAFATAFAVLSRAQFWLSRRDFFRNIFRGGFRGKYSS